MPQPTAATATNTRVAKYSLAHLTLLDCSVPELVFIAARAGYDAVSPRLIQMGVAGECSKSPLDKNALEATHTALEVTGIEVNDIELARITDDCDINTFEPALVAGAKLGASRLISSVWTSRNDDRNFVIDTFAALCDLAAQYDLTVALEFPTFSRLRDLKETADIVKAADKPNGGILIDTLYTHLSRVDPGELDDLPAEWFSFIHLCDVAPGIPDTREGMIHLARSSRLYPGEGYVDFAALLNRLPPLDFSIELPNDSRVAELGYEEHARRCLLAAKRMYSTLTH
ncbi:MAG: sugar phosphate isomerase/epimerase family protein [Thiolinea sp.]